MPRLEHPSTTRCLVGAAAAAALLWTGGCGGGADRSATDDPATAADAAAPSGSGAGDFCDEAAGIDHRVDGALAGLAGGDDPSIPDAFRALAAELRDIEAPDEIATAWEQMSTGLDGMADAFADVDLSDAGSLESLDQAEQRLTAASDQVESYLGDECGL